MWGENWGSAGTFGEGGGVAAPSGTRSSGLIPKSKKVVPVGMMLDWKCGASGSMDERSSLRCLERKSRSGVSVRTGLCRGCFFASSRRSFIGHLEVVGFGMEDGALEGKVGRASLIFLRGPWASAGP